MLLGHIVYTCGIDEKFKNEEFKVIEVLECVEKFKCNNWGVLDKEDIEYQNNIMRSGDTEYPYLGVYIINGVRVWIMKGIDRVIGHYTTVMLPSEY